MRTLFAFCLTTVIALVVAPTLRAQTATPSPAPLGTPATAGEPVIYGEYPLAYQDITKHWMDERLVDPTSATYEWNGEPHTGEITEKGQRLVGYFVDFKVTARNRFGGRTPKQKYRILIRNGVILWGGRPR
ncbi:MAG: hypothetical protein ACR2HH_07165 [Chthoniobacterales bacterium]